MIFEKVVTHTNLLKVTAMIVQVDDSVITPDELRSNPEAAKAADEEYALHRKGPRTAIPSSVVYLPFSHFIPSKELHALGSHLLAESKKDPNRSTPRDRILVDRLLADKNLGQIEYNFDTANYSPFFKGDPDKKYATMLMMLQYPFSQGSIHITPMKDGKKATMDQKPIIDPKYYQGPGGEVDFKMMIACQEFADKICCTKPLADIIVARAYPPASPHDANTEFDFSNWIRESTITDWHPVGTCSMGGQDGIKGGVIDDRLRVYGVKGLRVADASIMPLHIAAHPQATIYGIGEKAASLIREDWEKARA